MPKIKRTYLNLNDYLKQTPKLSRIPNILKPEAIHVLNELLEQTKFLDYYNPKLVERLFCYINGIHTIKKCSDLVK